MLRLHSIRLFLFILLTGFTIHAAAAPTVLVTVPALHSLVSGLMDGIAEPQLLMDDPNASSDLPLSGSQLRMLANVDMIVWAGPGLEKALQDAIENKVPAVRSKMVTLSAMVPLLANEKKGDTDTPNYRNEARNLEFWTDPRLSIIAIRTLTPRLVRLDPDNSELYLDNEIALIERLKAIEQEMANTTALLPVDFMEASPGLNAYFLHRMQHPVIAATKTQHNDMIAIADCPEHFYRKVATYANQRSPDTQSVSSSVYGMEFYFDMMRSQIEYLLKNNCRAAV